MLRWLMLLILSSTGAQAWELIDRPFQTLRSTSMGGVRFSTGLYADNFFGNPARAMANPSPRFDLLDLTIEGNPQSIDTILALIRGTPAMDKVSSSGGKNHHARVQLNLLNYYKKLDRTAFAFGILADVRSDAALRQSYIVESEYALDIGPAFTVARSFLYENALSIGTTLYLNYRMSSQRAYSVAEILSGGGLSLERYAGDGFRVDGNIGATYRLPTRVEKFTVTTAVSVNNVTGGRYRTFNYHFLENTSLPRPLARTINAGVSFSRDEIWALRDVLLAFEVTDIGNNTDGSLFRLIHIGGEAKIANLVFRAGINQGYLCAGFGLDLGPLDLEFGTYGEELSLNTGGAEDRRFGLLRLIIQI